MKNKINHNMKNSKENIKEFFLSQNFLDMEMNREMKIFREEILQRVADSEWDKKIAHMVNARQKHSKSWIEIWKQKIQQKAMDFFHFFSSLQSMNAWLSPSRLGGFFIAAVLFIIIFLFPMRYSFFEQKSPKERLYHGFVQKEVASIYQQVFSLDANVNAEIKLQKNFQRKQLSDNKNNSLNNASIDNKSLNTKENSKDIKNNQTIKQDTIFFTDTDDLIADALLER